MKCIRNKCFETNSSSTHSLVITNNLYASDGKYKNSWGIKLKKSDMPIYEYESLRSCIRNTQTKLDPHRVLFLTGGDYGREYPRGLVNSYSKANYLVTYIKLKIERFSERKYFENVLTNIFKKAYPELDDTVFTNANEDNDMNPDYEGFYDYEDDCNLDHEGMDLAGTILTSDGVKLKDFGVFSLYDFIFNTSYILISGEDCGELNNDPEVNGLIKIDENTYFTNASELSYIKDNNIKLKLSCMDPQEIIDKLEEK